MLTEDELRDGLTACLHVPRWVDEVAAAGPYRSLDVLLDRAGSRPEILAELHRRLSLDPETEQQQVGAEVREIALLRTPQVFPHLDHHFGYDDAEAAQ